MPNAITDAVQRQPMTPYAGAGGPQYSYSTQPYGGGFGGGGGSSFNPWQGFGIGSMIGGGIGQLLGGLFGGGGKDLSEAAMPYLGDAEGQVRQYLDPYHQAGLRAMPTLEGQYNALLKDPGALLKMLGGGFQSDPGYQYQVNEATKAANNAASAGGMLGSPAQQASLAETVGGLANQNYGNYMNRALGLYNTGLGGLGNMYQTGFNAAGQASQSLADIMKAKAQLAYASQAAQNQSEGGLFGSLGSLGGGLLGMAGKSLLGGLF